MHLLIITFDSPLNTGGIEGRVRGYVSELRKYGDEVVIQAMLPGAGFSTGRYLGVPLYTCPSTPRRVLEAVRFTGGVVRRHSVDAVFFLSGGATLFGVLCLSVCRLFRLPSAVLFYGKDILEARSNTSSHVILFASQMLPKVVFTNSRFTASLLAPMGRRKSERLYPSISPDYGEGVSTGGAGEGAPRILFVGRLVKRKGVDDLLRAVEALESDYGDLMLDIVGDGPERSSLENLVAELGLQHRATFHGNLVGVPLLQRYQQCSIFAMPSRATDRDVEGFGTVFLEAGWFAKPSLGTSSGGIPEAIVNGSTGVLVEAGNPTQLASALRGLLDDQALRRKMGQKARDRVLREFTWEAATTKLRSGLLRRK